MNILLKKKSFSGKDFYKENKKNISKCLFIKFLITIDCFILKFIKYNKIVFMCSN